MIARHSATWALAAIAVLVLGTAASWSQQNQPAAMPWGGSPPQVTSNAAMLMSSHLTYAGQQQTILIDTAHRTMAVYQVHPDTGVITLRSVRRMDADFGLEEFNSSEPSPSKIRNILPTSSRN